VRAQEAVRREFIDDLLSGTTDVANVLRRAAGFGMDLSGPHSVVVIQAEQPFGESMPVVTALERAILGSKGDAQALVATKNGRLLVVFPAPDDSAVEHVTSQLSKTLSVPRRRGDGRWQIGVGRPGVGVDGVVTSYREALESLELAARLTLSDPVVHARDLLVYQVLLRDQAALRDLILSTLSPLLGARGGAGPLLETLSAYFAAGANSAKTARSLNLSERAVTYRLTRVRQLTGHDPGRPPDRIALEMATLGARLLNWPEVALR
jgi:sugar diacid utilization regulator